MNTIRRQFTDALLDRRNGEVAMTYFKLHNRIGWLNLADLSSQAAIWKMMIASGDLRVAEYNREFNGYYTITLQAVNDPHENTIDPIARDVFRREVSGVMYIFTEEHLRDGVLQCLRIN